MRRHDWTGFAALAALIVALVVLARGGSPWGWFALAIGLAIVTRYWSLRYPAPMPHSLRWTLLVPRGNHSPEHLRRILEPRAGERILEIGPGVGVHSVAVAASVSPGGRLDVLDAQQKMLEDVMRRARKNGLANITPERGDAQKLPYDDQMFDAAYLIGVLGEIPDGQATLREVHRVLKPHGRLVVGEIFFDPDFIRFGALVERAKAAGFDVERKQGNALSYLARFRPR